MMRRVSVLGLTVALVAAALLKAPQDVRAETTVTPADARAIAKEAYIYANPVVDGYRIIYSYFVDSAHPDYIEFFDLYSHAADYIGTRTTGNDGGQFLLVGPGWEGTIPDGFTKTYEFETELMLAVFRTQLFNPEDLEKVKAIQADYKLEPLSAFLGKPAPEAAPAIDFIKPISQKEIRESPRVFEQLNFILQFCPPHPSEKELLKRFAKLDIGAGKDFNRDSFSPEMQQAIGQGIEDAWDDFASVMKKVETGEIGSGDAFGSREFLKNNYLYRMAAAVLGIWGNIEAEAIYPTYYVDADGKN